MAKPRKYTNEQFIEAVKDSKSIRQVLFKLKLKEAGGNYSICKKRILDLKIDDSHFGTIKERQGWSKGKKFKSTRKIPIDDILKENSHYQSFKLKKRLLLNKMMEPICSNCNLREWLNEPIPLELDHINGINTDNRFINLRLLCPNCHAKTSNYRGKNKK